jgi:hypothetical protein
LISSWSIDSNGNLDAVYTPDGKARVAVLNWHWDDQDAIRESVAIAGMPRDEREKFEDLINQERRHYHVGAENLGEVHLYHDLELALVNLREHLEEADAKSRKGFATNWFIFACVDACEGIE